MAPPHRFGSGWFSATTGIALAALALLTVLCFHGPEWLTVPQLRALYPLPLVRAALQAVLIAAFALGILAIALRRHLRLGMVAVALACLAAALGGANVPSDGGAAAAGPFLGVDWLVLNVLAYSLAFVPLERAFALRREQQVFRPEWRVDLTYFAISSLFLQATTFLTLAPARTLFAWTTLPALQERIAALPLWLQFAAIVLVTDLVQYWVHRAFHALPWLWRFHAVHHSATTMDWLAGSRLHLVDVVATRGLSYVPTFVLGFDERAIAAYLVFVAAHATFLHANVRLRLRPLQDVLATPRFHHWHHAASVVDVNFAVHLPVLDRLFGTHHLPKGWPESYGLADGSSMPPWFTLQFLWPFRRR